MVLGADLLALLRRLGRPHAIAILVALLRRHQLRAVDVAVADLVARAILIPRLVGRLVARLIAITRLVLGHGRRCREGTGDQPGNRSSCLHCLLSL